MARYRSTGIFGSTEVDLSDGPMWTITEPAPRGGVAPHGRTVFYLNDEEAEVIRKMRKAVRAQRELNRKRSAGED